MRKPPSSGISQRVGRILVIDDEAYIADSLRLVLSDEFEVTTTSRPNDALEWLLRGDWYDVVLCDVVMPTMNGVELRNCVHAVRPNLAARFVFVTGGVVWGRVRELLDTVPNLVLEKPFDFIALRELMRRRVRPDVPHSRLSPRPAGPTPRG